MPTCFIWAWWHSSLKEGTCRRRAGGSHSPGKEETAERSWWGSYKHKSFTEDKRWVNAEDSSAEGHLQRCEQYPECRPGSCLCISQCVLCLREMDKPHWVWKKLLRHHVSPLCHVSPKGGILGIQPGWICWHSSSWAPCDCGTSSGPREN